VSDSRTASQFWQILYGAFFHYCSTFKVSPAWPWPSKIWRLNEPSLPWRQDTASTVSRCSYPDATELAGDVERRAMMVVGQRRVGASFKQLSHLPKYTHYTLYTHLQHCHQLVSSDGGRQRARAFYQMNQGGHTHPKGRTAGHEPWWGQLYQLSHAYDRFLDTESSRRVKNKKNWVPASSDEGLW